MASDQFHQPAALARAAEIGGGDGAVFQSGAHFVEDVGVRERRPDAAAELTASKRERRPDFEREDAGGVRVVLEGARGLAPVGVLDCGAADGAEAGVGDELVRAGEDGDGVELDGAGAAKDVGDGVGAIGCEGEALGGDGDPAGFVGGDGDGPAGHGLRARTVQRIWEGQMVAGSSRRMRSCWNSSSVMRPVAMMAS